MSLISGKYFDISNKNIFNLDFPTSSDWQPFTGKFFNSNPGKTSIYMLSGNGSLYVGADKNGKRPYRHRCELKHQKHENLYLQASYDKYGISTFFYSPICVLPEELIKFRDQIENSYIKYFNTYKNGFNLCEFANTPPPRKPSTEEIENLKQYICKNYTVLNPNGETVQIKNLVEFCKENNLNYCAMHLIGNGKRENYKGWRSYKQEYIGIKYEKKYKLIDPKGNIVCFESVVKFTKNFKLGHAQNIYNLLNGKLDDFKGWRRYNSKLIGKPFIKQHKKIYILVSPDQKIFEFTSIKNFCTENNLSYGCITAVLYGYNKTHKGWTLK